MIRCTCGYEATSRHDFDEHVVAMMHDNEDHFEARGMR